MSRARAFFTGITTRPRSAVALSLLLTLVAAAGLPRLTRDTRGEAFIPPDHPALVARDRVRDLFGLTDPLVIAVVREGEQGVFRPETLALLRWLSDALEELPGVDPDRVRSIATERDILGTADGMRVEPFYDDPPETPEAARAIRSAVLEFELLVDWLVSRDGSTALIVAEVEDPEAQESLYDEVQALLARAPVTDEALYAAGEGAVISRMSQYIDADARRLNPLSALVVTAVLFIAYRTWMGVLLPGLLLAATVLGTMGLMAWAGVPIYVITNALPPLLLAVAVADAVHILGQYYEEAAADPAAERRELVIRAMVRMWRPVLLTSVTDIAGFLAIATASFMPPMRAFGLFASLGILVALALSLVLLPALMVWAPLGPSPAYRPGPGGARADAFGRAMGRLGAAVLPRPRLVVGLVVAVAAVGVFGALRLTVNESRISQFARSDPLVAADRVINERLGGTTFLDVVLETDEAEGFYEPAALERLEALQEFLEGQPHVATTTSLADYLKQMNRAMNEDQAAFARIPGERALVAQYLLLYEISGDRADLGQVVDSSYQVANVRAALDDGRYSSIKPVVDATAEFLDRELAGSALRAELSGRANVDYHWIADLAASHFRGVALASVVIWAVAALTFRSAVAGLLCLFPVASAVLSLYAVMGATGIWLGVGTTMFAAIAVGTGVDFAVHTLDRLVAAVRERGEPLEPALRALFPSTGRALLFGFAALSLGFAVLLSSHVPTLVRFGALVTLAVGVAFAASLTALPALVLWIRPAFLRPRAAGPTQTPPEL